MEHHFRADERLLERLSISHRFMVFLIGCGIVLAIALPSLFLSLANLAGVSLSALFIAVVVAIGVLLGLSIVIYALYFRSSRAYLLTNQRIIEDRGWLSGRTVSANYEDITDILITQDMFERFILNAGTVAVDTAGADSLEIHLERVHNPHEVSERIRQYAETRLKEVGGTEDPTPPSIHQDAPPPPVPLRP